jgi:transcriptional repressor NrdR
MRACEKRPVTSEQIQQAIAHIEEKLKQHGNEVKSSLIGEMVMRKLKQLDKIAYIRFASVYRDFQDIDDFKKEIKEVV